MIPASYLFKNIYRRAWMEEMDTASASRLRTSGRHIILTALAAQLRRLMGSHRDPSCPEAHPI